MPSETYIPYYPTLPSPSTHPQYHPRGARSRSFPLPRRSRTLLALILLVLFFSLLRNRSSSSSPNSSNPFFRKSSSHGGRAAPHLPPLPDRIDWTEYAYSQYATDSAYLCSAVMVFDALERFGSRAERVLFYPRTWDTVISGPEDRDSQLLELARRRYGVKLRPVEMLSVATGPKEADEGEEGDKEVEGGGDGEGEEAEAEAEVVDGRSRGGKREKKKPKKKAGGYDLSINKFHAWNLTEYRRVIHLDSDATLQAHLDDLFLLPPGSPVAMPRAYWDTSASSSFSPSSAAAGPKLSSLLVVLTPSTHEHDALVHAALALPPLPNAPRPARFDMDVLNARYAASALVLPHRGLALLTGEFRKRAHEHADYLGPGAPASASDAGAGSDDDGGGWDAPAVLAEARLVHFSDWPLPKPWVMWPPDLLAEMVPRCRGEGPQAGAEAGAGGGGKGKRLGARTACPERDAWKGLYEDFRRRRKEVCRLLSYPAPEWRVGMEAPEYG